MVLIYNIENFSFYQKFRFYMTKYKVTSTIFSWEKEINLKYFHSSRDMKNEMKFPFTNFKNEKWNENALILR